LQVNGHASKIDTTIRPYAGVTCFQSADTDSRSSGPVFWLAQGLVKVRLAPR
jgi:hypothetical protein